MKATTIRMDDEMLSRVDAMADHLNRSRSWLINRAIDSFLNHEEWLVKEIENGLAEARRGDLATEDEVTAQFNKWEVHAR